MRQPPSKGEHDQVTSMAPPGRATARGASEGGSGGPSTLSEAKPESLPWQFSTATKYFPLSSQQASSIVSCDEQRSSLETLTRPSATTALPPLVQVTRGAGIPVKTTSSRTRLPMTATTDSGPRTILAGWGSSLPLKGGLEQVSSDSRPPLS